MKQREHSEDRVGMSRNLAALAAMYDLDKALFRRQFAEFRREVVQHCFCTSTPKVTFRHLVTRGGRQRFVLFVGGRQFDFFEFDISERHGDPGAVRGALEKMSFQSAG